MDSCSVLIVGGGPAGSSCARALRSSGRDVLILDRATFPREKLCGGWITPQVVKALAINLDEYASERTLQPISGFQISALGQPEVEVEYDRTVSYGIRRCEFDDYLLRRCGARVREGEAIQSIERTGDGWVVNGEIRAKMLVGAGGHFCPVSKFLGNTNDETPVVAQEVEFEMDIQERQACRIQPEAPELFFCRDMQGYGWVFRKGNWLNIGLGRMDRHGLHGQLEEFVRTLTEHGKIHLRRDRKFVGHAYLLFGFSKRKVVDDGVLLIGDAAGLAYPQSGEGIRPAVESGLMAGAVIAAAKGDYSRKKLDIYAIKLMERYKRHPGALETMAQGLPRSLRNALRRTLLRTHFFARRVVEDWFLHMGEQALKTVAPEAMVVAPPAA